MFCDSFVFPTEREDFMVAFFSSIIEHFPSGKEFAQMARDLKKHPKAHALCLAKKLRDAVCDLFPKLKDAPGLPWQGARDARSTRFGSESGDNVPVSFENMTHKDFNRAKKLYKSGLWNHVKDAVNGVVLTAESYIKGEINYDGGKSWRSNDGFVPAVKPVGFEAVDFGAAEREFQARLAVRSSGFLDAFFKKAQPAPAFVPVRAFRRPTVCR